MAYNVVVKMWLSVNSNDSAALAWLDEAFPRSLERKWSRLVYNESQPLNAYLNVEVHDRLKDKVERDHPNNFGQCRPFPHLGPPTGWIPGNNGNHEMDYDLVFEDNVPPPHNATHTWKHPTLTPPVYMGIHISWERYLVPTPTQ